MTCLNIYEPAEPRIKDEKVRKALRAWAEANELLIVYRDGEQSFSAKGDKLTIDFDVDKSAFENVRYCINYTITELCGRKNARTKV